MMDSWRRRGLALAWSLLLLPCLPASQALPKDAPAAKQIDRLLATGEADKALQAAYDGLALDADDLDLLELASRAAEEAKRKDEALWLAHVALRTAFRTEVPAAVRRRLVARAAELDPLPESERPALGGYGGRLFDLGKLCVKDRLYANAVDFFSRCAGTSAAPEATKELEKLYKNRRATDAMLASGLDVPLRLSLHKSEHTIAKEDKRHKTWKKAWKLKGDNYTVVTDTGYELGSAVLDAMDQMNRFYRVVFQHKQHGGGTARCTIRLYKNRAEFEEHEGEHDAATQGFYSSDNYVACYDPRSTGLRLSELWETLFHEASHQFTHMISTGTIPGWLDEGTATYFEGARRQGNGRVESNLVHEGRLENLKEVLEKGSPSVKQVVSWFSDDSYGVDYYPVGGYLVYFFKNYENDACERIYAPVFDAYMKSYHSGGKHDPFARFVEYFVEKVDDPDVTTFDQFVARFKKWCLALYDLEFGPPARAEQLIARAERERAHDKFEAALDSYRWALDKRYGDPRALLGLAEVHAKLGEHDAEVYCYRQLLDVARRAKEDGTPIASGAGTTPDALIERCTSCITEVESQLSKSMHEADAAFREEVETAARKYVKAGYPRVAIWTLDAASEALSGQRDIDTACYALRQEYKVDARLWRKLPVDLDDWLPSGSWRVEGAGLVGAGDKAAARECLYAEEPPERYRFEVTMQVRKVTGQDPFMGILYGVDEGAEWDMLGTDNLGTMDVSRALTDWRVVKALPDLPGDAYKPFKLAIEVARGRVRFFVQGKHVYTHEYPPSEMRGRIGVMVQDLEASFTDMRIAY